MPPSRRLWRDSGESPVRKAASMSMSSRRSGRNMTAWPMIGWKDSARSSGIRSVRSLHVRVVRPAAAFRRDPDDVLRGILDVAGLAMHAVLRVDLQARAGGLVHDFVDARR